MEADAHAVEDAAAFRFGWREHLLNFGFWTVFGAVTAAILLSNDYEPTGERQAVVEALHWLTLAYLWAALTPVIFWLVWRFSPQRSARLLGIPVLLCAALIIVVMVSLARTVVWDVVLGFPRRSDPDGVLDLLLGRARPVSEPIVCAAIFAAAFVREHFLEIRARQEQAMRLRAHAAQVEAHAAQLQAQLARARIAMLRSQLNPHFLFNALNAVSALVDADACAAQRMIARLSDLLRLALQEREAEEIPLREELTLTRHYLEILEIRFPDRLQTCVEADPDVLDVLVPNLILQPIVENAMKHGVGKAGGRGRIEVRARRSGESLVLTVRDTGGGGGGEGGAELGSTPSGAGVGLTNTRARLEELYGSEQRLALHPMPEGGMTVEIVVPFRCAAAPVAS